MSSGAHFLPGALCLYFLFGSILERRDPAAKNRCNDKMSLASGTRTLLIGAIISIAEKEWALMIKENY